MTESRRRSDFHSPPNVRDLRFRIEMTVACNDCNGIPKHPDAGTVFTEDGRRIQIMHNGLRVIAGGYGEAWTEEIIARLRGHHEPQEELAFHELLKRLPRKATMIELGGNWSYYSLWFLSEAPGDRRAIVVEPDPNGLALGRTNAALNGHEIEFLQASVGERSLSGQAFKTETAGILTLRQVTVGELLEIFAIDHLDVLHCDVQGAELAVVQSTLDLFEQGCIRYVVFSTHAHAISGDALTHQRCLALLDRAGAKIIAEHDVHESFSGDGLIVAGFGSEADVCPEVPISYNRYSSSLFRNPLFDLDETSSAKDAAEREVARLRVEGVHLGERLARDEQERSLLAVDLSASRQLLRTREQEVDVLRDLLTARDRELSGRDQELERARIDHAIAIARHEDLRAAAERRLAILEEERLLVLDRLSAAREEIQDKSEQIDRWGATADRALRELNRLKASWRWRVTRPLRDVERFARRIGKRVRRS